MQIKAKKILDTNKLFWGHSRIVSLIGTENSEKLCDLEIVNWISFIYWGEDLAMTYVSEMLKHSENKEKWQEIYEEEFRHKTMIGSWLLERGITPDNMSGLIEKLEQAIKGLSSTKNENKVEIIKNVQLFLEEALFVTLKYRFDTIKDRDLKSILYTILKDEASHISEGKKEISLLNGKVDKMGEIVKKNIDLFFPIHLGKKILSEDLFNEVKKIKNSISEDIIDNALKPKTQDYPLEILRSFQKIPEYNCVACCPTRHDGLHLEPKSDGEVVYDLYRFPKRCEGFNNIVHGGFLAMALDEVLCYSPILGKQHIPLTKDLNIKYKKPVVVGIEYKITSKIIETEGQIYRVYGAIEKDGDVYCEATGTLYIPDKVKAPMILGNMSKNEVIQGLLYQ